MSSATNNTSRKENNYNTTGRTKEEQQRRYKIVVEERARFRVKRCLQKWKQTISRQLASFRSRLRAKTMVSILIFIVAFLLYMWAQTSSKNTLETLEAIGFAVTILDALHMVFEFIGGNDDGNSKPSGDDNG